MASHYLAAGDRDKASERFERAFADIERGARLVPATEAFAKLGYGKHLIAEGKDIERGLMFVEQAHAILKTLPPEMKGKTQQEAEYVIRETRASLASGL